MDFDHIGIPTEERREGMWYLETTRCWLTKPSDHPFRVEWLWFEPESEAHELIRTVSHVAYRVDDLGQAMAGHRVIAEPFDVGDGIAVSFVEVDGAPVEFVRR